MKSGRIAVLLIALLVIVPFAASAQDPSASASAPAQAPAPASPAAKEIAIYGEVQAVNVAGNTLSVQYYDYDSDSEKTAEIGVGKDTKMENAKVLGDIKKGDWVDVTYTAVDGKNVAKVVSVEKEEPTTEAPAGTAAATE